MQRDEKPEPSRWPESDKLSAKVKDRDLIVAFLDWCEEQATADVTVYQTHSHLAHRFLKIDEEKLERERRDMLDELRMLNNGGEK